MNLFVSMLYCSCKSLISALGSFTISSDTACLKNMSLIFMHSDPGRAKITQIEKKNKVVVEMKYRDDSDDEARESVHTGTSMLTWTETAVCSTPTGQTITTVVGDITDLSVCHTQYIHVPTSSHSKMSTSVRQRKKSFFKRLISANKRVKSM
jgi:hypothetical protein